MATYKYMQTSNTPYFQAQEKIQSYNCNDMQMHHIPPEQIEKKKKTKGKEKQLPILMREKGCKINP